ncbi:MAG: hypothetical protein JW838_07765 [Spirochaetes bacterium]|nr:hypothetical protein [Spirochaetota bacterium]
MKHTIPILALSFIMGALHGPATHALEVDVDEIRTRPVRFINYKGKRGRGDSRAEIEAIGAKLARGTEKEDRARFFMKYSIIRAVSKEEPDKFSADIFSIDRDARVGHIAIVRRITGSYLMNRYGYSRDDARTISIFLSYYNAVHRRDLAYFRSRYKSAVLKHISARNAGIALRWSQWPGATKMLIPLSEGAREGRPGGVEPDVISDDKTIEEIRKDDRNIEDRKKMTDLRERKLERDRKKIEDEKKAIDEKKEAIRKKEEELKKEKEKAKRIEDQEERKKKEDEIKKEEKKLEEDKKELKKKEEQSEKKKETIKKREESIKKEKRRIEKDEIKRDIKKKPEEAKKKLEEKEKELDKREDRLREKEIDKNIYGDKLYYLKIREYLEGGHYNNELYMIDPSTLKVLFKSPVEHICGSRYDIYSGGIVIITHKGSHTSGHRLTLVDRDTLTAKIHGNDNVFWRSFIEIRDGFIYAILYDGGNHYLGRFDGQLKLTAQSKERINENTFISFWGEYVYINRHDKTIIVLNKSDLSLIGEVKP